MAFAPTAEQENPITADLVKAVFTYEFNHQQSRRHGLNELYKLLHRVKSEEDKKNLISAFVETLLKNLHANPSFHQTSSLCKTMEIKKPKVKDVTPDAFLSPYVELDESELEDEPEELAKCLKQLLEISKHLSLIATKSEVGVPMIDVPTMDKDGFQIMCRDIFIKLKRVKNEVYGKWSKPGTWGRPFKYRKIRKFYDRLRKSITAQLAINEQLIFTEGNVS